MTNKEFIEKYKDYAIDCQIRYGIPASVTLMQGIIESKSGNSDMACDSNNFFGIKKSSDWKGPVDYYLDDHNYKEPFKHYNTPGDSFDDHAKLLLKPHYQKYLSNVSSTDYVHFCEGLQKGNYATAKNYAYNLAKNINDMGLYKLDQEAVQKANSLGVQCGYAKAGGVKAYVPLTAQTVHQQGAELGTNVIMLGTGNGNLKQLTPLSGKFCMPLDFSKAGVEVSSAFGVDRGDHKHGGLDIRTNRQPMLLYATEDNGVIKEKGKDESRGNFLIIEYTRSDNSKIKCTYMHLNEFTKNIDVGTKVNAGNELGLSGDSGRSTGIHLHFEVEKAESDGTYKKGHGSRIDPTQYLAELQVRSGQAIPLAQQGKKGFDYLASARSGMTLSNPNDNLLANQTNSNDPKKWLERLMLQNNDLDGTKDTFSALVSQYFTNAFISLVKIVSSEKANELVQDQKEMEAKAESLKVPERGTFHVDNSVAALPSATQLSQQNYETIISSQEQTATLKQRL